MEKYIEKAKTIIEALPYIKEFNGKTIVVKYGGAAMDNDNLKEMVIQDFVLLHLIGIKIVIVHGGGPHITNLMKKLGKEALFIDGHRITDEETMEITEMVLSGLINKDIIAKINSFGCKSVGLSGKDANLIVCKKKNDNSGKGIDFGQVGTITKINPDILFSLLDSGYLPVISPVGIGEDFKTYNINADTAAAEIAISLKAEKLIYLTDVKGIYKDINDESTFYSTISEKQILELKSSKAIDKGMLPKVDSAIKALKNGVKKIHIIDGRIEHSVLLEILTDAGIGTEIIL